MRVRREASDDPDVRLDLGVGLVDDAERGLAARDQRERRAHVLDHRKLSLDGRPGAELLQRRLGILADRHRPHVGGHDPAVACELGEVEAGCDCNLADL